MKKFFLLLVIFSYYTVNGQDQSNRKTITTTRVIEAPKIDGVLDDAAWNEAEIITNFVELRPDNGKVANKDYKTEVRIVYNDKGIYIGAMLYYPDVSNIPMEFATRDNFGQSDFFLVTINPIDDGQNPFQFIVQSTGNQADAKIANGNEDYGWNAVWESDVKVNEKGLAVEMMIPYRALRFSNTPIQSWGFNFHRRLENLNSQYTWTHIDNSSGATWTQFDGIVEGFKDLKPPTRLSFYPYASVTTDTYDGNTENDWSVGMDVKYGLSENFTLDATLIPDFSQVGFDNQTLNLGPFEQQFSEQRQFFTEGTELFSKGQLFYSRRIGGRPIGAIESLDADEEYTDDFPNKVTMLNAVKVSGRTKGGLGIGFFNAITEKTEATVTNTVTKENRDVTVNPFSNYNILVLDQQFNKNSSVTLINTNVWRNGDFRDSNVTGLLYNLKTKDNKYFVDGSVKMSSLQDVQDSENGYTFDTSVGKISGKWRGEIGYNFQDKNFDPNDLGILFSNNQQRIYSNLSYRTLKPTKKFNRIFVNTWHRINFLHRPGTYVGSNSGFYVQAQLKSRFGFGGDFIHQTKQKDFFEPRQGSTSGIYFEQPERFGSWQFISTNYQKKLALDYNQYYNTYKDNPKRLYGFNVNPRYRATNQLSFRYGFNWRKIENDRGYIGQDDDNIHFSQRDRKSITNSLSSKYSFSVNSSISLTFRHNWETVSYDDGLNFNLQNDGSLSPTILTSENQPSNVNYNNWNLDLNYTWQFAPGSQLIAFYRNSIFGQDENSRLNFNDNLDNLFNQPKQHLVSLRFVYFIDYNNAKNWFKKNS